VEIDAETEEKTEEGMFYEGMIVAFKLRAQTDKQVEFVMINDMAGDYKLSYLDNKFFAKINLAQTKKNNVQSVWHLSDPEL